MEEDDPTFREMMHYPKTPPVMSSSLSMEDRHWTDVQLPNMSKPKKKMWRLPSFKRAKKPVLSNQQEWSSDHDMSDQGDVNYTAPPSPSASESRIQRKAAEAFLSASDPQSQRKRRPVSLSASESKIECQTASATPATTESKIEGKTIAAEPNKDQEKEAPSPPAIPELKINGRTAPAHPPASEPQRHRQTAPAYPPASEPKRQQQAAMAAPAAPAASQPKMLKENDTVPDSTPEKQAQAEKEAKEQEEWLAAIEAKFSSIAGEDKLINYEEFRKAIDSKEEIFVKSYFRLFDEDGSGEIGLDEFMESLRKISQQSDLDKLRFLFSIFDADGDGEITPEELKVALRACMSESSLKMSDDKMDQLVGALMKSADVDGDGVITFEELKTQFEKYPMLVKNLAVSPSNWLKLHQKPQRPNPFKVMKKEALNMYYNNMPLLVFLIFHTITFAACFFGSVYRYRNSNGWVMLARGCGMSLNYHAAMLALSMARRSLTFMRNTPLGPYLAVDDHIELHKMLGVATVVLGLVHTVAHLANIGVMVAGGHALSFAQILFTHMSGIGYLYGTAYPSGVLLTIILVIMGVCSSPMIRRAGLFEFFYKTHLLYIPFWVLTLAHGPIFWIWFLVPGIMIFTEHCYSHARHAIQKADTRGFFTTEVNLLPSKVIHLVVTRPKNFKFNAGDYVFIQIPTISAWEWHPFSISSAPEEEGILWIHIRMEQGWTKRLYELYEKGDYVNSIEEYEEEDCWKCGNPHNPPRGGKCTKPRRKGYSIATRLSLQMQTEKPSATEASALLLGDVDDFPSKEDYMLYLKAAREELNLEVEAEKLRGEIVHLAGAKPDPNGHPDAHHTNQKALTEGSGGRRTIARRRKAVKTSADLFRAIKERHDSQPEAVRTMSNGGRSYQDRRKVYIEGPFGSAAVRMGDTNHAVLVAAGIGVTPFASVLQSLVTGHRLAREDKSGGDQPRYKNSNKLKKIDFIWVNRKADDFDWFITLLTQLEMEEARQGDFDNFMDMHLFMTAAKNSSDLKGVGLQMALELVHQEDEADMITGLKTRTQAGRPNWKKLFQQFKDENKGQVHVYYCGGPGVAKVVKSECDNIGFKFSLSL